MPGEDQLPFVIETGSDPGLRLRPAQSRKQQGGQDRYNGDDNQQFDQGKSSGLECEEGTRPKAMTGTVQGEYANSVTVLAPGTPRITPRK